MKSMICILLFFFCKNGFTNDSTVVKQDYSSNHFQLNKTEQTDNQLKPPLSVPRILGELAAGTATGLLTAGFIFDRARKHKKNDELNLDFGAAFLGVGGYLVGTSLGVSIVGNIGNESGHFGSAFMGSLIGLGSGFIPPLAGVDARKSMYFATAMVPIMSTFYFNKSRSYDKYVALYPGYNYKDKVITLNINIKLY